MESVQDPTGWQIFLSWALPISGGLLAVVLILLARRKWGDKSGKSEPFRF